AEDVAFRIMRADAGEWAIGRSLDQLHCGGFFAQTSADFFDVFNFEPEMFETRLAAQLLRNDVHADVSIAYGDSALWPRGFPSLHTEERLIKPAQKSIVVTDDGEVLDFCKHRALLIFWGIRRRFGR